MARHDQRYNDFLNSYRFFPNSIEFRISSSQCMEKWKNVQAFQMNQLINGKFFFPQDRREILLLKYDMWSRWLVEIENLFIELYESSDIIRQREIDLIVELAEKTSEKTTSIIFEEHSYHFNDDFSKIWVESHEIAFKYFIDKIRSLHGTYSDVFGSIVDLLCDIMQHTLNELHEINEMVKNPESDSVFIAVTPFCIHYLNETSKCIVSARIKIFKKYFNFNKVWFKNYTNSPLPAELAHDIEDLGVSIDYIKCVFK